MLRRGTVLSCAVLVASLASPASIHAATPCDGATRPAQCGWFDAGTLPPFVHDTIVAKGGTPGAGNVLVLTSGDPADPDSEISNDVGGPGCGTNPDGWETFDCVLLDQYTPAEDSVVLAVSSEWFEWYQTIFTDWMTIAGAGVATVDVSINSWINSKVDVLPYGPMDSGAVILTSLVRSKMASFRVADSGDHIYDTAVIVVPATWFAAVESSNTDATILCGDGILEPGEECDDGNTITDDGCSSLCRGTQPPPPPAPSNTCGNLVFVWPNGTTAPYTCGADLCAGYRCLVGNTISPACYDAAQCAAACAASCVDIPVAQLDCGTMCAAQPPATEPPPVLPQTCGTLVYAWPDGTTMPYTCDDTCIGQRCVTGTTVDPACYGAGECNETTCPAGICVDTPAGDCAALCALADLPQTCTPEEVGQLRQATNQHGRCHGNMEICDATGVWKLADGSWEPQDEMCNGLDDDCNGVADDMFVTCGDPGLCQNTVNSCDPANPTVPVQCVTLPPPSPVEICNNGLDDDCDGSADDGCECGDDECMPGETYASCPADCPPPPNGTPCDDGNLCTGGDTYQGGACQPGPAVSCDASNACVIPGGCDPATGCTATKLDCDDFVACTADSCDPSTGCLHAPNDGLCDDANACTIDSCTASGCTSTPDPGAVEVCNGADDDCDTLVDEGFEVGTACESAPNACGETASGTRVCTGDGSGTVCDATTPPATLHTFYRDADGDGYGDAAVSTEACTAPAGWVADATDCDDADAAVHPGAAEVCNGIDDDCDGVADPFTDADGDGVADCGADLCPGTLADAEYVPPVPAGDLGKNRWALARGGGFVWVTTPQKKPPTFQPTVAYTRGCSCKQILDALRAATGAKNTSQYQSGCSRQTLEGWHAR